MAPSAPPGKIVCVAGASGLVGANITREALARGYTVRGTLRDRTDPSKAPHLQALPGAAERLTLLDADMADPGAFNEALAGADGVFVACLIPTYFGPSGKAARDMDDEQGYAEIVAPTVEGCLNIMRSAVERDVRHLVICSSTSSTNPPQPVPRKNEVDHWSDENLQYRQKKYTSAAKTVMEKAAMTFAEEQGVRLCILLPTLMLGPALIPAHAEVGIPAMLKQMIAGGPPRHTRVPNDSTSMIHVEDVAKLFLAAYENPDASGRYFGVYDSWHWEDIYAELARLVPEAPMPEPLDEPAVAPTGFDFTRRDSLGVALRDIPTVLAETVAWLRETG
jgi:nucleoside-diphosphate-sugar epimerase